MRDLRFLLLLVATACGEVQPLADADSCTGTCECRVDEDCAAPHTGCNDQTTSRTCECIAGYSKNLSGACEFSGVVANPSFGSTAMWQTGGTSTIDANLNVAGMVDPGAARFQAGAVCALARVRQQVQMPKLSRAEPLVAQITYRWLDQGGFSAGAPGIGFGPVWHEDLALTTTAFRTSRVCLGAGQFAPESTKGLGATLDVAVSPAASLINANCTNTSLSLDIDRFDVVVANPGECPDVGQAINGDAEGMGGWVLAGSSANGAMFSASIAPNVGEGNSKGVRLFATNRCSNLSAVNRLSIPAAAVVPSPAISFFDKTSAVGSPADITSNPIIGGNALPRVTASGIATTQKLCLPAFTRGSVVEFFGNFDISGTCADVVNAEAIFDNLKVVNDPTCGADTSITDPGFESPLALVGVTATAGKSLARALNDPANAHGGTSALQLSVMQLCDGARWQANVIVPPANGNAGPALTFFYKATAPNHYTFTVGSLAGGTFTPVFDNMYHQGTLCLNPKLSGRNQIVQFAMSGGSGTCATTHPPETAFVDDLAATTAATCPAM